MIKTKDYYYDYPPELVAQKPLSDRSASRLLVLDRKTGAIRHELFRNIAAYLGAGDCLVLNDSKVLPARLLGKRHDSGAKVELLLLRRLEKELWEALVKPGKKCRVGDVLSFGEGILTGTVNSVLDDGKRLISFTYSSTSTFEEILASLGEMPLPPYIKEKLKDQNRYQTVYACHDGSAAAPTAGLHFTEEILKEIEGQGVKLCFVTLHVGLGTFRPVKVEDASKHQMHSEYYEIPAETARIVNETKAKGGRVICVGTTSCRTVESVGSPLTANSGETEIFIYPGYQFQLTDGLITNFHLPESTLLMLVAALAGRERVMAAYEEAIREGYRLFSFGDAMLIV